MDPHALAVLEFPAIVERLAAATESAPGAELARGLLPSADPDEVARRQALTAEALALLDAAAEPSLAGVADVREAAARAARDGVLGPDRLRAVATAVAVALEARRALDAAEPAPLLAEAAAPLEPALARLAESIERCVEDDGSDLRDTASPRSAGCAASCATGASGRATSCRGGALARAARAPAGAVRHRARRPARARGEAVGARARCRASSTTRRARGRRCSSSRSRSSS